MNSNASAENYYKKYMEGKREKVMGRFYRGGLRGALRERFGLGRAQRMKEIENKYKREAKNFQMNKKAIETKRAASNEELKLHMNRIKNWAKYSINTNKFSSNNYKKFRSYYISELNKIALQMDEGWKSRGVRSRNYIRSQLAKAADFRAKRKVNLAKAKRNLENAQRATARAYQLKMLSATGALNKPRARLITSRLSDRQVKQRFNDEKRKIKEYRNKAAALTAMGNAQGAAGAAAQANAIQAHLEENGEQFYNASDTPQTTRQEALFNLGARGVNTTEIQPKQRKDLFGR
jgi:hypothetical protein